MFAPRRRSELDKKPHEDDFGKQFSEKTADWFRKPQESIETMEDENIIVFSKEVVFSVLERLDVLEACLVDTGNKNMAQSLHEITKDIRTHCALPTKKLCGDEL